MAEQCLDRAIAKGLALFQDQPLGYHVLNSSQSSNLFPASSAASL